MTARWWICPDDPEAGYIDADDGEVSVSEKWVGPWVAYGTCVAHDVDGNLIGVVEPATCSICEGEIPDDANHPLCTRCDATARAHARLEREAAVQREEGVGRG